MRPPLALVALLLLTACSSGGNGSPAGSSSANKTDATVPAATASTSAGATPSASGAATAPSSASAGPQSTAVGGTGSSAPATRPLTTTAPGAPAAQKATAAGNYTLDTSGTVTLGAGPPRDAAGTSTLTVSPVKAGAQHTKLHSDQGDTEQDLLVRSSGTYAAGLTLSNRAFTKSFQPTPAVLLVPDPAKVGATWSWSAVSTDGQTTAKADNQVLRTETLTIGGTAVPCVVLRTHLVLSGDLSYDAIVTTWYTPDHRLAVKDNSKGKGSYSGFPFSTDITSVVRSVQPS